MKGIVKSKQEVAKGTLEVTFKIKEPFTFTPGQFVFITLDLKYPDDRGTKRQFSINNDPSEAQVIKITTRISESGFKKTLKDLEIGSELDLGPIGGKFVLPEEKSKQLVFIAGGIGITPFMSMLRHLKVAGNPYKEVSLVYSNRDQSSTAFLQEIQQMESEIPNFKLILSMTEDLQWEGEKRRVDAQFIKDYFPSVNNNHYMVVGPPVMVEAVITSLAEAGVSEENIEVERFTGY